MSEDLEAETTEDGYTVDENGEFLADPADVPVPAAEHDELEPEAAHDVEEIDDPPDLATGRSEEVLDFLLGAQEAAALASDILRRKITVPAFRQLVIDGDAPAAAETTDGTAKWSLRALRAWAQAVLAAEAEAAAQIDPAEEAAKERNAFVHWVRERLDRFESHDDRTGEWCRQWWDHPEAVDRFHALWLAYMAAEAEDELSGWWVNHWDRHFAFLFSKSGVFSQCAGGMHKNAADRRKLPYEPPPDSWFPYQDNVRSGNREPES